MGRPEKIPRSAYSTIRDLDVGGHSPSQIQTYLADQLRISVSLETLSKILRRVRVTPPDFSDAEGLSDLLAVRAAMRSDLLAKDRQTRQGAARLLVEVHQLLMALAEKKSAKEASGPVPPAKVYTTLASPDAWPAPPKSPPDGAGGTP